MNYSDNQLQQLAKTNAKELARILTSSHADIRSLTMGAEFLGAECTDEEIVLPVLRKLLKHINAVVREGAALGISSFYMEKVPPQDILDRLAVMASNDPSPAIRDTAKFMLEEFESNEGKKD